MSLFLIYVKMTVLHTYTDS